MLLWEIFTYGKQPWFELSNHEVRAAIVANCLPELVKPPLTQRSCMSPSNVISPEVLFPNIVFNNGLIYSRLILIGSLYLLPIL